MMARQSGTVAGRLLVAAIAMISAAALASRGARSEGPHTVEGLWLNNDGKATVEVKPCGGEMCGSIVWLKDPLDPKGRPWTDMLNPDKGKRSRQVCGMQIIGGLKPDANGLWSSGWVYDPEAGKAFDVEISLENSAQLKVFGFAGVRLLSETMMWTRQPATTPRCRT